MDASAWTAQGGTRPLPDVEAAGACSPQFLGPISAARSRRARPSCGVVLRPILPHQENLATSGPESLWQYVFFDLDGTVTASHMGIIRSVQYALRQMGRPVPEAEALMPLIGPPLQESFGKLLGGDPDLAREATRLYREYYTVTGIYENKVYDGVEDLLRTLQEAGRMLCLATSKPEPFARRILQHFGLDGYFSQVAGAELDGRRTGKTEVLRYAAALCGMTDPATGLMVGDRKYDVAGAHSVGLACAGVLYGYGSREELQEAGADWLCPDPACLRELVLGR